MLRLALVALLVPALASAQGLVLRRSGVPTVAAGALQIVTTDCPDAVDEEAYIGCTFEATGGTGARTWDEVGSALGAAACTGLTLTDVGETATLTGTPTATGTCSFVVRVDTAADDAVSRTINLDVISPDDLPEDWFSQDIGTGQAPGSAEEDGMGVFTVAGAGADVGTSSQLHLAYKIVTGDQEIKAELTGCTAPSTKRCGVLVRATLTPTGAGLFCGQGTNGAPLMQWRSTDGGTTGSAAGAGSEDFFRITVEAGAATCYVSTAIDGSWSVLGSTQALPIGGAYYLGLAAFTSSAQAANLATATFDTVTIEAFDDTESVDFGGRRAHLQGPGTTTTAGRGGVICAVNSLADTTSGAAVSGDGDDPDYRGTFRYCTTNSLDSATARYVVFETSGRIDLLSTLSITIPNQTWAFQTAPSPGVTISRGSIHLRTSDLHVWHLRHRMGSAAATEQDCVWIRGDGIRIVFDHVSLALCTDETMAVNGFGTGSTLPQDVTWHDSIIGPTPFGGSLYVSSNAHLLVANASGSFAILRTLYAHNDYRNPEVGGGHQIAIVNTLKYNYALNSSSHRSGVRFQCTASFPFTIEGALVNNLSVEGPDTVQSPEQFTIRIQDADANCPDSEFYLSGNEAEDISGTATGGFTGATGDGQWAGVHADGTTTANVRTDTAPSWFTAYNYHTLATSAVEACVVANAGARPEDRDSIDTTVIANLQARTGSIPEEDAIAVPTVAVNTQAFVVPANPHVDSDGDGRTNLDDTLETAAAAVEDMAACGL